MTIKSIDRKLCDTCELRIKKGCPVVDSCAVDVLRFDNEGRPLIVYLEDCHSCFLCEMDCPRQAVHVSAEIPLPVLPY